MHANKNNTRRDFLRQSALAAAAFTIVPRHVLGGQGFVAPSERLVVAGIGAGHQGAEDLRRIHETGKVEIPYLCDVDDRWAAQSLKRFPKAKYYKDFRKMLDKEHRHIDAVTVSTPDHNHAIQALAAMQLGKHVYVQKPLAHDVWEVRVLADAAKRYKVVTQMGNQGASNDGPRQIREWYEAGLIGDVHTVYCWTDRPFWPHRSSNFRPVHKTAIPKELDWDLWLGTAPTRDYLSNVAPGHWRDWWDYGTGALGDMGCHMLEVPFSVLSLQHVQDVHASVGTVYVAEWQKGEFGDNFPPSSHITLTFPKTARTQGSVTLHWMDGGILPSRPREFAPEEKLSGNGTLLIGTKGKILADVYGGNARLLPTSRKENVPQKYARVAGQAEGHLAQWVEACLAGYGQKELSSPFGTAALLTEAMLVGNIAMRVADKKQGDSLGRNLTLLWDHKAMRVTNFDLANQFVKRTYRQGWEINYPL